MGQNQNIAPAKLGDRSINQLFRFNRLANVRSDYLGFASAGLDVRTSASGC
jgi:hypothetical protein